MKRPILFLATVAIMAAAMLSASCKDDDEDNQNDNGGGGSSINEDDQNSGNGQSKGRILSVSEFDKSIFESINPIRASLGKDAIEFSNVIWKLAVWNSEKDGELDTKAIQDTLMANYGIWNYGIIYFHPYQCDSIYYKEYIETKFKSETNFFNADFTYGAFGSYNDNGTWKSTLLLLVTEN